MTQQSVLSPNRSSLEGNYLVTQATQEPRFRGVFYTPGMVVSCLPFPRGRHGDTTRGDQRGRNSAHYRHVRSNADAAVDRSRIIHTRGRRDNRYLRGFEERTGPTLGPAAMTRRSIASNVSGLPGPRHRFDHSGSHVRANVCRSRWLYSLEKRPTPGGGGRKSDAIALKPYKFCLTRSSEKNLGAGPENFRSARRQ